MSSPRVQHEWRARIAAEYTSAAITQHLTLWLIQAGAPPDLIDAGLAIVADELVHSRMSHEVYVAAGGGEPPALDRDALDLKRTSDRLELDILRIAVRVFCLGETVAVPLFKHLREACTEPVARAALDRILRDEVRHRDFGWDLLDWLLSIGGAEIPALVSAQLPEMLRELAASYGTDNTVIATDDGAMTAADRAWGLAPPRDYAEILARTLTRDYAPRFAARDIAMPAQ
ncbi:MAG: ferritin-like domain-containing protein [Deltaproteobacteria bacterium]|nr:ferritin-like domain-containing protein [Deltaproteobacteria bacterium]